MRALQFENNKLFVSEVPKPVKTGEALIKVTQTGICNTDIEIVRGYAGFTGTLGHEFVGVVEESSDSDWIGKRVIGEINVGCDRCDRCNAGDPRHCEKRTVLGIKDRDGCHADYLTLPVRNLLEVPAEVSDEQVVFAEPLAAAYGITEQVDILRDTKVAVIGDGKLGILCAWSLGLKADNLFLIGKHQNKLNTAEKGGNVQGVELDKAGSLRGQMDVVVEASGSESGFGTALDLLKPRGKLVLKSTFHGTSNWEAWRIVVDEITIVGSRCGMFTPVLDILKKGRIDASSLISDEFELKDGVAAFERAMEKGAMKVLLKMST